MHFIFFKLQEQRLQQRSPGPRGGPRPGSFPLLLLIHFPTAATIVFNSTIYIIISEQQVRFAVRGGDDRQQVFRHPRQGSLRELGERGARRHRLLLLGDEPALELPGRQAAPTAQGGRQLPAPEEVLPDAGAHVGQLRGVLRVVPEGRRRPIRQDGPAGVFAAEERGHQEEAPVRRPSGQGQHRGIRAPQSGVRRELLHGRTRGPALEGDFEEGSAAREGVLEELVHQPRGRGAGEVRQEVRRSQLHLELRDAEDTVPQWQPTWRSGIHREAQEQGGARSY